VKGTRKDAQKELTRLLAEIDKGVAVARSQLTVANYLRQWLGDDRELSPKTRERYVQLAEGQIIPHLGGVEMQKLRPAQIQEWHGKLIRGGSKVGEKLSSRTVGHAHRLLHKALARAVAAETLSRNVAGVIKPPKVVAKEVEILTAEQIKALLSGLEGHWLHAIAVMALGSGARRGELLAVRWQDLDLDAATLRVERSLEETRGGLRFKEPKSKHGKRTISLPSNLLEVMRVHKVRELEQRMATGARTDLVFATIDGAPMSPDNLSRDWIEGPAKGQLPRPEA
jgi:integrase